MASLKIFISSTCYDMHSIRGQLKSMLLAVGYDPIMSDQADVIYDPRSHTHTSCLREVENCDAVIVVIGSRFGGVIIPKALETIDMSRLGDVSRADRFGEDKISITQAEVIKAIEVGLPVFAFVDSSVMRDHLTYEKNKKKAIINEIDFSSIDRKETAAYIFEFINFLRLRNENNSIFEFSRFEEIETQLKKQWSGLFQRLLHEQRAKAQDGKRIDYLSSQIADLKAAVLGSISNKELKETAKGAIRFRHLVEFISAIAKGDREKLSRFFLNSRESWVDLLKSYQVLDILSNESRKKFGPKGVVILLDDETYFVSRIPVASIDLMAAGWEDFKILSSESKGAILDAVLDGADERVNGMLEYRSEKFEDVKNSSEDAVIYQSRTYVSVEQLVKEVVIQYLSTDPELKNMVCEVDTEMGFLKIRKLASSDGGRGMIAGFRYNLDSPANMTAELEQLKFAIKRQLTKEI